MDTLALEGSNAHTVFLTVLKEIYRIISKKSLAIKDIDFKGVSLKGTKIIIPGQEKCMLYYSILCCILCFVILYYSSNWQ
ncbi:hypothetical protein DCAR_0625436 [Daucus carota subsp. sativus]|uniref:Uncharacterized protein n=1 Tax=Daucus carota subsp. sativus TaxID=79200 RepID=A0AAF0XDP5_DAUCS|nr:hypothetical protein DCAR_0625436 [Daucus carota subsp. sativus]